MRLKLFLFLITLAFFMVLSIFLLLLITGTLNTGVGEVQKDVEKELAYISQDISDQYVRYSAHAIELSKVLSASIEMKLKMRGLSTSDLKNHPELLEEIVGGEYAASLSALQRAKSSGVFMILDATVNPALEKAENSKAGLYIKNMEPNILSSTAAYLFVLRGFPSIGRDNAITLHSQWRMEFDVTNAPYYRRPIKEATDHELALSRLYYWSDVITLPGANEEIMLCSVPLINSKGHIFGVCGFEVSAMLFKLSHTPNIDTYQRVFSVLSPTSEDTLNISQAFSAGSYSPRNRAKTDQTLTIKEGHPFMSYRLDDGTLYSGLHRQLNLYPEGSAFAAEKWAVAVMLPDEDISAAFIKANLRLTLLLILLLAIGSIISYLLSKRYLKPFAESMEMIKSNDFSEAAKTKVVEIDDLVEFLSSHQEVTQPLLTQGENINLPTSAYEMFAKNTELLSPAERAVFNLYVEGHTAKEITGILNLSINTIKTHNKRIYMKLNVASRDELLVYVNMLKEAGSEILQQEKDTE
ncbi:MAG TPA: LuxR C-terminal-related transcriptional regulator [Oscillospiraceae bacterium]|nr:LuxR C-terminal-related transcriptional regulator [Oscillospiraceae bacterium]